MCQPFKHVSCCFLTKDVLFLAPERASRAAYFIEHKIFQPSLFERSVCEGFSSAFRPHFCHWLRLQVSTATSPSALASGLCLLLHGRCQQRAGTRRRSATSRCVPSVEAAACSRHEKRAFSSPSSATDSSLIVHRLPTRILFACLCCFMFLHVCCCACLFVSVTAPAPAFVHALLSFLRLQKLLKEMLDAQKALVVPEAEFPFAQAEGEAELA